MCCRGTGIQIETTDTDLDSIDLGGILRSAGITLVVFGVFTGYVGFIGCFGALLEKPSFLTQVYAKHDS